jgi:hypothetical protein
MLLLALVSTNRAAITDTYDRLAYCLPFRLRGRRNAILRKTTVGEKADTEMIYGRLMLDAVVSGRLPHSAQSPVRVYNGQGLHLRP